MPENNDLKSQLIDNFNKSIGVNTSENVHVGGFDPAPAALDYLKKYTGNPIKGSNPELKTDNIDRLNDYSNNIGNYLAKNAEVQTQSDYKVMKPFSYNGDYDGANFERYYNTPQFDKLGFSPYRDNESLYNANRTIGDDFVRAASNWPSLVMTGIKSGVTAWGDMFSDPLAPDLEGGRDMARAMARGSSTKGGLGGFGINTALNMGYTVGIGAEWLGEELALAGATALSGGTLAEGTIPAMIASAMGATSKIRKAAKLSDETIKGMKYLDKLEGVRAFWNENKAGKVLASVGSIINPLDNTWEIAKGVARGTNSLGHANKYARNISNFGEFARDIIAVKGAVSEAKLEGGSAQIDITGKLIDEYREKNGKDPEGAELGKIESLAKNEAYRTAFWNLPAIMWSNKFMYETIFKPFSKGASQTMEDIAFKAAKGEFYAVGTSLAEKAAAKGRSLASPKTYLDFTRNYMKANLAEGIQENLQEAISKGATEHALAVYRDPSQASYESYMGHFMSGLESQLSAQGAETFAGGFLMGSMAQPIMAGPMKIGKFVKDKTWGKEKFEQAKTERAEQINKTVETLNKMYKNQASTFAPELENLTVNTKLANDLYSAHAAKDKNQAENIKDASVFENIYAAAQAGHLDTFTSRFKEYMKMTPEEVSEGFLGVKDAKLGQQAINMMSQVIERTEQIKEKIADVNGTHPNPFINNPFKAGTSEHIAHNISRKAWSEGQKNLVFAQHSFDLHSERIVKLANALVSTSAPLKNVSSQDMMILLDSNLLKDHLKTLRSESKLTDASTADGKKEKAFKLEKIEILENFQKALAGDGKISKPIINYIKHLAKDTKSFSLDSKLQNAITIIKDNHKLRNEQENLVESINVMHNPQAFFNIHRKMADAFSKEMADYVREARLKKNLEDTYNKISGNNALNDIKGHLNMSMDQQYLVDFFTAVANNTELPEGPLAFFDHGTGNKITSGPKFDEALEYWNAHKSLIVNELQEKATEKPTEKPETKPTDASTTKAKAKVIITDTTKWNDLPSDLQDILEPIYQSYDMEEPLTRDEFISNHHLDPGFINILKKYNGPEAPAKVKTNVLAPQFKGKFIYATPGIGKTNFSKGNKDIVDTDKLIIAEINSIVKTDPQFKDEPFVQGKDEEDGAFIHRFTQRSNMKSRINATVLAKVKDLLKEGKTVLTGTSAFAKDVDIAFTSTSDRLLKKFGSQDQVDSFLATEKSKFEPGKLINIGKTEIEDVLSGKVTPEGETVQKTVDPVQTLKDKISGIKDMLEYDKRNTELALDLQNIVDNLDLDVVDDINTYEELEALYVNKKEELLDNLNMNTLKWIQKTNSDPDPKKKLKVTFNKLENTDLSVQHTVTKVTATDVHIQSATEKIIVNMDDIDNIKIFKEPIIPVLSPEDRATAIENTAKIPEIIKDVLSTPTETIIKPTTTPTDIEALKQTPEGKKIEEERKLKLNSITQDVINDINAELGMANTYTIKSFKDKINAEYDLELAALSSTDKRDQLRNDIKNDIC